MDLFNQFFTLHFFESYADKPFLFLGIIFLTSILGSTHCVSMCGPIAMIAQKNKAGFIFYQLGRLFGYLTIGTLLGLFGQVLFKNFLYHPVFSVFLSISVILTLLAMILHLWGFPLKIPHRYLSFYYFLLKKLNNKMIHLKHIPFMLGIFTSLLPCGWLGFFYLISFSQKDAFLGAWTLVFFWAGSLPVFLLLNKFSQHLFYKSGFNSKKIAAVILSVVVFSLSIRLILHSV